jgi:hypothetical protein
LTASGTPTLGAEGGWSGRRRRRRRRRRGCERAGLPLC